jgi:hypothetical protein
MLKPSERIQQLADELRPQLKGSTLETSEAELRLCCVIAYLDEHEASVHPDSPCPSRDGCDPASSQAKWIRAADGTTLESGEYEVVETHARDDAPILRRGDRFTVPAPETARYGYWQILTYHDETAKRAESTWVSVARRIGPIHPAPASPPGEDNPEQVASELWSHVAARHQGERDEALAKLAASEARRQWLFSARDEAREFCERELVTAREALASSEARCNQLTGELAELDTVTNRLHSMVIEPLEAKLTESEATVARLRKQLEGAETVVVAARKVIVGNNGYQDIRQALAALDQSQPEPAGELLPRKKHELVIIGPDRTEPAS